MNINNFNYLYDINGNTIGVKKNSTEGQQIENAKTVTYNGEEWITFDSNVNLSNGITVDKLNINQVISNFIEGNLTSEELQNWLKANNAGGFYISEDVKDGVETTFIYNGKKYTLHCNWQDAQMQTDKPISYEGQKIPSTSQDVQKPETPLPSVDNPEVQPAPSETPAPSAEKPEVQSAPSETPAPSAEKPEVQPAPSETPVQTTNAVKNNAAAADGISIDSAKNSENLKAAIEAMGLEELKDWPGIYVEKEAVTYTDFQYGNSNSRDMKRLFVWDPSVQQMKTLTQKSSSNTLSYTSGLNANYFNSNYDAYEYMRADQENMEYTTVHGLYMKGDQYYVFYQGGDRFEHINEKEAQIYIDRGYVTEFVPDAKAGDGVFTTKAEKAQKAANEAALAAKDPHFPQGYTMDELVEEFGDYSYYLTKYQPQQVEKLLSTYFVQDGDTYYLRSDFTFDGKKVESIDDLKDIFVQETVVNWTRGKYYDGEPVVNVSASEIQNCGYNFLPEEIDAYFDKNSDGSYTIKSPALIVSDPHARGFGFYTFDDLVTYLKGGHTGARELTHWGDFFREGADEYLASQGSFPYINAPKGLARGLVSQTDVNSMINHFETLTNYAFHDFDFSTLFKQTQHGEYVVNQETAKKLFPNQEIKTISDITNAMDALICKFGVGYGYETDGLYELPKTTQVTEADAKLAGFTVVKTAEDLLAMAANPSGKYILMGDIDMSGVEWTPIGDMSVPFAGELHGNGYTISNLNIKSDSYYTGMFGVTDGALIYDLNIEGANIINTNGEPVRVGSEMAENGTGVIAGYAKNTDIRLVQIKDSHVEGRDSAGLLAGIFDGGKIDQINATDVKSSVSGKYKVGGIVGNVKDVEYAEDIYTNAVVKGGVWQGMVLGSVDNGHIGSRLRLVNPEGTSFWGASRGDWYQDYVNWTPIIPDETTVYTGELTGRQSSNVIIESGSKQGVTCTLDPKTGEVIGVCTLTADDEGMPTLSISEAKAHYGSLTEVEMYDDTKNYVRSQDWMKEQYTEEAWEKYMAILDQEPAHTYSETNLPDVYIDYSSGGNFISNGYYAPWGTMARNWTMGVGYASYKATCWVNAINSVVYDGNYDKVVGTNNLYCKDGKYYRYEGPERVLAYRTDGVYDVDDNTKAKAATLWEQAKAGMVEISAEEFAQLTNVTLKNNSAAYPPSDVGTEAIQMPTEPTGTQQIQPLQENMANVEVIMNAEEYEQKAAEEAEKYNLSVNEDNGIYYKVIDGEKYNYVWNPYKNSGEGGFEMYTDKELKSAETENVKDDKAQKRILRIKMVIAMFIQKLSYTSDPNVACDKDGRYYRFNEKLGRFV